LFDRISVERATIRVINQAPPEDALAYTILEHLVAEPSVVGAKEWLLYLRHTAAEQVGQRLLRAGHVRRVQARRLMRTITSYVPVDMNTFLWPATRLEVALHRREQVEVQDLFLAGLINVTDLHRSVIHSVPPSTTAMNQLLPVLPPSLRELLVITDAVFGDAVLNPSALTPVTTRSDYAPPVSAPTRSARHCSTSTDRPAFRCPPTVFPTWVGGNCFSTMSNGSTVRSSPQPTSERPHAVHPFGRQGW
jgi:Golgi phosphoprotein 3 (GPP34)